MTGMPEGPPVRREDWTTTWGRYMAALDAMDVRAGTAITIDAVDAGARVEEVVAELLAPGQEEVGRLWYCGDWSVAQEHAATAVADAALAAVSMRLPASEGAAAPSVVVACAPGEWHSLPARMGAAALIERGFRVLFLGAAVPSDHLQGFIELHRPLALALSCTHPLNLPGARDSVAAARGAGVPTLACGRAFGTDDLRARAIGAAGWAEDAAAAAALLKAWQSMPPNLGKERGSTLPTDWQKDRQAVSYMLGRLEQEVPAVRGYDERQRARTIEDAHYILAYARTATDIDDERIFSSFLVWLRDLLEPRGVPWAMVARSCRLLAEGLEPSEGKTANLLQAAGISPHGLADP